MPLEDVLQILRSNPRWGRNITAWETLPMTSARFSSWPGGLDPRLVAAGQSLGIDPLYLHQAEAVSATFKAEAVVLSTGTASGKTLGYILPVLDALLRDPSATALLIYPTKALANDQIAGLERWIAALQVPLPLRSYDGDTPQSRRAAIRREARILVTNPDMLHLGILPHHTQWSRFFTGLRFVVLDEMHIFRGVFGSHVANVLRRLRRVAHFYGAAPRLVGTSATIANPAELTEALWQSTATSVEDDGAPYGERHIVFYNPPLLNPALGLRAHAGAEAAALANTLLHADVATILFGRSRLGVELLLRDLQQRAVASGIDPGVIRGYRGGYLPGERREIEAGLRKGKIRAVVATNALELGIDIGSLEASILVGYPGSIAAARQQMGRAGRRAGSSLAVMIATPQPLDQYLVGHPEYFFGRSPEAARVNPDAVELSAAHLACAAFELPWETTEPWGRESPLPLLEGLRETGVLHQSNDRFTWVGEGYPAQMVSLRSASPENVIVQSEEIPGEAVNVIATVDRFGAAQLVYEGAIYFHDGASYQVKSLDWVRGEALVKPVETDYYTVASATSEVERLEVRRTQIVRRPGTQPAEPGGLTLADEEVRVHTRPTAYRRVAMNTYETLGWGEIHLPEQCMETDAFRLTLGEPLIEALADEGIPLGRLDYGPEWPAAREAALVRDNHHCRLCGLGALPDRPLEVHHLTPLRSFLAQYPRGAALRLAHDLQNLMTLCPTCHRRVEQARGARTALGGLAYLLQNLAPVFLMCDPGDLGVVVEPCEKTSGLPGLVLYDIVPGGAGLAPQLVDLWPKLVEAALERLRDCPCYDGCPSCVGPVGDQEAGVREATRHLLDLIH